VIEFDPRVLHDFASRLLQAAGTPLESANLVTEMLIEGDRSGHGSHGLIRLPLYIKSITTGQLNPNAKPTVVQRTPVTALIDGDRGFGQVTTRFAVDCGLEIVAQRGLAAVATKRVFHIGRLGDYPERAAREGWIALAWANGLRTPPTVAPFGGAKAAHGTNPFAAAIPRSAGQDPIVVDFATARLAEGKIQLRRNRGDTVPEGVLLDDQGQATTDPNALYEGGALLTAGEHKGYGLSVVCDLLAGLLTGTGSPCMPGSVGGNPIMLILLDPACFRLPEDFLRDVDQFCEIVKSTPPAKGHGEVLIPGDPEHAQRRKNAKTIPLDESTWQLLVEEATSQSVRLPEPK
jgi:LDH2 family malate/lactate/ureidoglycolate dehydrogenase